MGVVGLKRRGIKMSLLAGVLPNGKSGENGLSGEGYNPSFAGIFILLRPGTGALRGLGHHGTKGNPGRLPGF
jgi:hypothetical protein